MSCLPVPEKELFQFSFTLNGPLKVKCTFLRHLNSKEEMVFMERTMVYYDQLCERKPVVDLTNLIFLFRYVIML